jgi:hypothetical protein
MCLFDVVMPTNLQTRYKKMVNIIINGSCNSVVAKAQKYLIWAPIISSLLYRKLNKRAQIYWIDLIVKSWLCCLFWISVCGSDGESYDSECDLHRESCLQNNVITIKHHGICLHTANTFKSTQSKSPCYKKICSPDSFCVVRGEDAVCECPQCTEGE